MTFNLLPPSHMSKSLALLDCGRLPDTLYEEYGPYGDVFTRFFRASLPKGAPDFILDSFDVVHKMEYPSDDKIDGYDAIVLTGSGNSNPDR